MNMANINIKYKGLTGLLNDLTIDNGQTMTQLRTAIIADEGLQSYYYGRVSIHKNGLVKDSTDECRYYTCLMLVFVQVILLQ
jgi:hypothetical protein